MEPTVTKTWKHEIELQSVYDDNCTTIVKGQAYDLLLAGLQRQYPEMDFPDDVTITYGFKTIKFEWTEPE